MFTSVVQKQLATFSKLIIAPVVAMLALVACTPVKPNLEIHGGSQLTIQLKPTKEHPNISKSDLDTVKKVVESRMSALGVSPAAIGTIGNDQITLELVGVKDSQQAVRVLGSTAQLEFRPQKAGTEGDFSAQMKMLREAEANQFILNKSQNRQSIATNQLKIEKQYTEIGRLFDKAVITGKQLKDAHPESLSPRKPWSIGPEPSFDQAWTIAIEFDAAGGDAFAQLTKKLAGTGRSIGVFIDNVPISTPTVDAQFATVGITGGKAVISGNFTAVTAQDLAIQLRSGALPVPIKIIENRKITPK
jgi:preprotein translocase subunit SecD